MTSRVSLSQMLWVTFTGPSKTQNQKKQKRFCNPLVAGGGRQKKC
jgi:hypothetical protein